MSREGVSEKAVKIILTWTGTKFVETAFEDIPLNRNTMIRVVEKDIDASNPRFSGITETDGGDTQK